MKLGRKDYQSDQEVRWCPGCGDYSILAACSSSSSSSGQAGEPRLRVRHRLRRALPLLHEHVRVALDPRSCTRGRDGSRARPARPRRVGDRRRRRHALDRWEPPDPCAAQEHQPQDHHVQQPDLRPDQGPVLAHERSGQDHKVVALRLARHTVQPRLGGARGRGDVRGPHPRHGSQAHDGDAAARARAPGQRRSWRSTRTATSSTTPPSRASPRRRCAPTCSSSCTRASRSGSARTATRALRSTRSASARSSRSPTSGRTPCSCTTRTRTDPTLAFALSRLASQPTVPTPIGVFRDIARPTYEAEVQRQIVDAVERQGPGDLAALIGSGATWDVN